jgi:hypothetical protein
MSHRENDQQLADFFSMEETDIQDWIQIGFFHDE